MIKHAIKFPPLVSVVIPTFNRINLLSRCLRSLEFQTFKNFEVIVCDDESIENIPAVVNEFACNLNIKYLKCNHFGGPARARNLGIENSKGAYIAFLDADDWWTSEKLEKCMELFARGFDVVYHNLYLVDSNIQSSFSKRTKATNISGSIMRHLLSRGLSIPNSSAMVRASILNAVGFLSEDRNLISVEDLDLWIRISRITNNFKCIPESLGFYWIGGGNISAANWKQVNKIRYLYSLHLSSLDEELKLESESFLDYRIARIAINMGRLRFASKYFLLALKGKLFWKYRVKSLYFLLKLNFVRRIKIAA